MAKSTSSSERAPTINDLIFVGFNKRIAALDRYTGEKVWEWKAKQGSGFVAILIDGDRLIVSTQGYTYCLDPLFGQEVWSNPLEGMGVGVPCLASVRGGSTNPESAAADITASQQRAAAAGAT